MIQQTDKDLHILALIHGPYGTGKTTLAHTMPGPRLVFEVEHGSQFVRVPKVEWKKGRRPPKEIADPNYSTLCNITDWGSYRWFMDQVLHEPNLPSRSVVFDTWSKIQSVLSQTLRGRLSMDQLDQLPARNYEHWDKLKTAMEQDLSDLNLVRVRPKGRKNILITSATDFKPEPHIPLIKGGAQATLPELLDLLGYLEVERIHDLETDVEKDHRRLDLNPHTESVAQVKCRIPSLSDKGDFIYDPNMAEIIQEAVEDQRKYNK